MKKLLLLVFASLTALGAKAEIYDVRIDIVLDSIGNGQITEVWDITATKGTEFYLVKENLGNMVIGNLSVTDETGTSYLVEENWISKGRSIEEKAGRCGIATTKKGKEICWGLGTYGHHTFTVRYSVTNMIKGYDDADILHFQFVSPKMSSAPKHALVHISFEGECAKVNGFGYKGKCQVEGQHIVAETTHPMKSDHSVIILARFAKGTFLVSERESGNYIEPSEKDGLKDVMIFITILLIAAVAIVMLVYVIDRANRRSITGFSTLSEIEVSRTVPFGGDILKSWYILKHAWENADYTSALVLKFAKEGFISIQEDAKGKMEITFDKDKDKSALYDIDLEFLRLMVRASGRDGILQKREFGKWASLHLERIYKWNAKIDKEAKSLLEKDGTLNQKGKFTELGKERACKVLGYYKYLKEYGYGQNEITDEMIFGALCGFSSKLMKIYRSNSSTTYLYYLLLFNSRISTATSMQSSGNVSVSGGGGFSGGGVGGGCR